MVQLILLLVILCQPILAQPNQFSFSVEYSPCLSKLTKEQIPVSYKLSHNALVRIQYNTEGKIKPLIGLGYFNTGEAYNISTLRADIDEMKYVYTYDYIIATLGGKYNIKNFYVLTEAGLGVNTINGLIRIIEYTNGEVEKRKDKAQEPVWGGFSKFIVPIFLSIGREFRIHKIDFSAGLKGYYVLNEAAKQTRRNHYGVGILVSVNI